MNKLATRFLGLFRSWRRPTMFLQSFFAMTPESIYNGGKVSVEVERDGEDIAIPIKQGTGPNWNDMSVSTLKEFTPPAYNEGFPVDVEELVQRTAGVDPYSDSYQSYVSKLFSKINKLIQKGFNKITRALEVQASQILQTGKLNLLASDGTTRYELDFLPKATHFPTVSVAWSSGSSTKTADLSSLLAVIRADGLVDPRILIFGETAMNQFLADDGVQKLLDTRNFDLGQVSPEMLASGATFFGRVWIGSYLCEMWTYPQVYKHPQTGAATKFIDDNKVVVLSNETRLVKSSARVPLPLGSDPRLAGLMPGRMADASLNVDMTVNLYCTPNGKQVMAEVESRPLLVPVGIDQFGCLTTTV